MDLRWILFALLLLIVLAFAAVWWVATRAERADACRVENDR